MAPFEFVFFLYALMLSLALTHLIGGWSLALRDASHALSGVHWDSAQQRTGSERPHCAPLPRC